jgi:hypothetical protein
MSFTKQMQAAIELDDIPQRYKFQENRSKKVLVIALVVALFVGGIGLAVMFASSSEPPVRATLIVESTPPGATVKIDGVELPDPTPVSFKTLPGARHDIEVDLPKYRPWHQAIVIPSSGGDVKVPAILTASTGKIVINSIPGGAEVWINGEMRGVAPTKIEGVDIDQVKQVELRLKGFASQTFQLAWSNDTATVDAKFYKK